MTYKKKVGLVKPFTSLPYAVFTIHNKFDKTWA